MIVYGVLIISKIFHSEYVDSIFLDQDAAVEHAEELEEMLNKDLKVEVEPFDVIEKEVWNGE